MKKILSILMAVAVIFTFSFVGAFATTTSTGFASAEVGKIVNNTVNAVDTTPYLLEDTNAINVLKSNLISDTKSATSYDADVVGKIETFKSKVAEFKIYEAQKSELATYKKTALTDADNQIAQWTAILTDELNNTPSDTNTVRKSTLTKDINTYKIYIEDQINAVEIVSQKVDYTASEEVNLTEAISDITTIISSIKKAGTDVAEFYTLIDQLNGRTALISEAERYAKVMALEVVETGSTERKYSDKAIANVLADVKDKINLLALSNMDKDETITGADVREYMKRNCMLASDEAQTDFNTYKTNAILSITTGDYALNNWSGSSKTEVKNLQTTYTGYINAAKTTALVDAYVSQAKEAIGKYKTDAQIAADEKKLADLEKENKDLTDKLAKSQLDTKITNLVNAQTDTLRCTSKKVKGNIKVYVKGFDTTEIAANGYTVKYTFYRAEKKSSNYKKMFITTKGTYTNTYGEKGIKYFYKVKITVYDKDGAEVVSTKLSDCRSAYRIR